MNKFTGLIIIGLLIVGGVFLFNQNKLPSRQEEVSKQAVQSAVTTTTSSNPVREFTMTAKQWAFDPAIITVKQGDKVKLKITSIDVTHGFALSEFNVKVDLVPNKEETVEFIADKKGEFNFFCSVLCGEGHRDMKGKLVVE